MNAVFILVGICIALFALQAAIPGFTGQFALVSAQVVERPWTLVTAIFLHGDLPHLLFNMFALALFGIILENIVGRKRFLWIFFAGGILASVGSVFLYTAAVGASGAIFAVLGALAILRPRMQVWVSFVPMPMIVAAAVWAIGDFIGLFVPTGIANLAHLARLGFGLGSGLFLRSGYGQEREAVHRLDDTEFDDWEKRWMK